MMARLARFALGLGVLSVWGASPALAGQIDGCVTQELTGVPLTGITVQAEDNAGDVVASGVTDSPAGCYQITGLPDGVYVLRANGDPGRDLVGELYDGVNEHDRDLAARLVIQGSATLSGKNFVLGLGGTVSGVITGPGGAPVEGASVGVTDASTHRFRGSAGTASDGSYVVGSLRPGSYRVLVWPPAGNLAFRWYHSSAAVNAVRFEQAEAIGLSYDEDESGRSLELVAGTSISGTVAAGPDFSQLSIEAHDAGTDEWLASVAPNGSGAYQLANLPEGSYKVRANARDTGYVSVYWPGAFSFDAGTPITTTVATPATGKDFTLALGGSISGTVCFDADGNGACGAGDPPLGGVWVDAQLRDVCCGGNGAGSDPTTGAYTIRGLPDGNFVVRANPQGSLVPEYWPNAFFSSDATVLAITSSSAETGKDFSILDGSAFGTLTGRVLDPDPGGQPVIGVQVRVQGFVNREDVAWGQTGADGRFTFSNLPAECLDPPSCTQFGTDYRVLFDTQGSNVANDQDLVAEYWTRCQANPGSCDPQVIDPNDTKVTYPTVLGVGTDLGNFKLTLGGSISGTVCLSGQTPPCGGSGLPHPVRIRPQGFVSGGPGLPFLPESDVRADGFYRVRGLPGTPPEPPPGAPGQAYRVQADVRNPTSHLVDAYYAEPVPPPPGAFDANQATAVYVNPGVETPGKHIFLFAGGSISGTVFCSTGGVGIGVPISVHREGGPLNFWANGATASDGTYTVGGLPAGQYRVQTGLRGPVTCSVGGSQDLANASLGGVPVTTGLETGGKNLTLPAGGTISGRVTYFPGAPEPVDLGCADPGTNERGVVNIRVAAYDFSTGEFFSDAHTSRGPCPDDWGFYTIQALPQGRQYEVRVETHDNPDDPQFVNFIRESWNDAKLRQDVDPVPTSGTLDGTPVTGIDFALELGGAIAGIVTDEATGDPLIGANVCVNRFSERGFGNCDQTDQNGFYVVRGLPEDSYRVSASAPPPPQDNYVRECWDDVVDCSQALPVAVPAVTGPTIPITGNIDFALASGRRIGGTVTSGGQAVASLRMVASQDQPPFGYAETLTNAAGSYMIVGLASGAYRVFAYGAPYAVTEQPADVTSGDVLDLDFDLEPGATLTGRVTDTNDDPIRDVSIVVSFFADDRGLGPDGGYVTTTDSDGYYTFVGLPVGSFKVFADGGPTREFVGLYWDGQPRRQQADEVRIDAPADVFTANFRLPRGATIKGKAFSDEGLGGAANGRLDAGEMGVGNVSVSLASDGAEFNYFGETDSSGDFTITGVLTTEDATPGGTPISYRAIANARGTPYASEYYKRVSGNPLGTYRFSQADTFTLNGGDLLCVDSGRSDCVDFSLVLGGSIAGTVRDGLVPLGGIDVSAQAFDGDTFTTFGFGARSDANGHYLIDGLPPAGVEAGFAGTYRVQADDNAQGLYVGEFFDDVLFWDEATPLAVAQRTSPQDALASTANFDLARGGSIAGTVTGPSGPVADVNINVADYDTGRCCLGSGNRSTDSNGAFAFGGLPAGLDLRVEANPPAESNLARAYYDGNGGTPDPNAAARVNLAVGETRTGIDFTLTQGGAIAGRVLDPNGAPLVGLHVSAQPITAGLSGNGSNTEAGGVFTIPGLTPGAYRVSAGNDAPYAFEFYDDKPDNASADPVVVTAGSTTALARDIVLTIRPAITPGATVPAARGDQDVPLTIETDPGRLAGGLCAATPAPPCSRLQISGSGVTLHDVSLVSGTFGFQADVATNAPLGARSIAVINDFAHAEGDGVAVAANVLEVTAGAFPPGGAGLRLYAGEQERGELRVYSVAENAELLPRIGVGGFPDTIAPAADGNHLYVAGNRSLSVVDLRLGREVYRATAPGLFGNGSLAATSDRIYAVSREVGANSFLRVFDARSWQELTAEKITVGLNPMGLRVDPSPQQRWLYVANQSSASVSVVCLNETNCGAGGAPAPGMLGKVVATIPMPAAPGNSPRGVAFLPDGSRAYVVCQQRTYAIDTVAQTVLDLDPNVAGVTGIGTAGGGRGMIDVVADAYSGAVLAYVGSGGGRLYVIDTATNQIVRTVESPTLDLFRLRATPERVFLSYGSSKDLYVLDTTGLVAGAGGPALPTLSLVRIDRDQGPAQPFFGGGVAVAGPPGPASGPSVTSVPASARPGDAITVGGTGFDFSGGPPIVWLVGTHVSMRATGGGATGVNVTLPGDAPAGTFPVAVTNVRAAGNESGVSAAALQVLPGVPGVGYAPTQNVYASGDGRGEVWVYEPGSLLPGGSVGSIQGGIHPEATGIALTPDGKRGVAQQVYQSAQQSCDVLPDDLASLAVFDLDATHTTPPNDTFRTVLGQVPWIGGLFETPAVTPDPQDPNGVFVYQPARFFSDTVAVIDPYAANVALAEIDVDGNPGTQTFPSAEICNNFDVGSKLPGISRIELDATPTDFSLNPNEAAAVPDGTLLYVANLAGSVSIVDAVTRQAKARLTRYGPAGNRQPFGQLFSVAVSPLADFVYVSGLDAAGVPSLFVLKAGVFQDSEASFQQHLQLGFSLAEQPRNIVVVRDPTDPNRERIYLLARAAGELHVVERSGSVHTKLSTIPVAPGIASAALAAADRLLYVSNAFSDVVHVVDLDPTHTGTYHTVVAHLAGPLVTADVAVQAASANPRIDFVSPPTGPTEGGTPVVISGANFVAGAKVQFGKGLSCSDAGSLATVASSSTLTVATPPRTPGSVDVLVRNPDGLCDEAANAFRYVGDSDPPDFTTPPYVASQVLIGTPPSATVSAEIRWNTDEVSDSVVAYGLTDQLQLGSVSDGTDVTNHAITLTGLAPDTTYYFQATSTDVAGNPAVSPAAPASFATIDLPDQTPPEITSGPIVDASHDSAVVQWLTDEDSSSTVNYGTIGPTESQPGAAGRTHTVTLPNLSPATLYQYQVVSTDASANPRTSSLDVFETDPVPDTTPPQLIPGPPPHTTPGPFVSYLSNDLVIITWQTDEQSTSFVNYGVASVLEQGVIDVSLVKTHVVYLTNLQPNTAYVFQFGSRDAAGNTMIDGQPAPGFAAPVGISRLEDDVRLGVVTLRAGTYLSQAVTSAGFTTLPAPDRTPPGVVGGPTITVLGSDRVLIEVETNEAASLLAQYGIGDLTASAFEPSFTQHPTLLLTGLTDDTTYQLTLVLTDPKGNAAPVPGLGFTTDPARDETPPVLSGLAVSDVTATTARVSWTTDEPADSAVRFGPQGGVPGGEAGLVGLRTSHSVNLTNLSPGTTYDFQARSRDGSGNVGMTGGQFSTPALPPQITSLAPSLLAQNASTTVAINGQRFEPPVTVDFGAGISAGAPIVNELRTQVQVPVDVADNASLGPREVRITTAGGSASATLTIVDETPPTITISQPAANAELLATMVTVLGTLSEPASVTVNGVPASVTGTDFEAVITLPGPGLNTITVVATDPSGNVGSAARTVKVMTVAVSDAAPVNEAAGSALFTLTLSAPSAGTVTLGYATADGSAQSGGDYVAASGFVSFPAGATATTLAVALLDDASDEPDESFLVDLTASPNAAITDGQGTATILDDDAPPSVSAADAAPVTEGNSGTATAVFPLSLSAPSGFAVAVSYATTDGSAQDPADYVGATGSVTFPAGSTATAVPISVRGDTAFEPDESFFLDLTAATNATLGNARGQATILNDDAEGPSLSISDASALEHSDGSTFALFAVTLSAPSTQPVTVAYATADGTATAASGDYVAASGTLSFKAGATLRPILVRVNGDTRLEGDETFFVNLSAPSGASLGEGQGQATIKELSLTIDDASVTEGDSGTRNAVFTVRLSYPTLRTVRVDYRTVNGSAVAPGDYAARSGTLLFPPGVTSRSIAVPVRGDTADESDETFGVELSRARTALIADGQALGTILDDDP
jgi:hypothetical protein